MSMLQPTFNVIATLILLLAGIVWNRNDVPNLIVKVGFILSSLVGFSLIMVEFGYIVKI